MCVVHRAVRDHHVLGRTVHAQSVRILARLDDNAIVAGIDVVIRNAHKPAGVDHNAVGVHAGIGFDDEVLYGCVLAVEQMHRPHGRTDKAQPRNQDILAVHEADERGPQLRRSVLVFLFRNRLTGVEIVQQLLPMRPVGAAGIFSIRLLPPVQLHPVGIVAHEHAAAHDGDILKIVPADQRHRRERFDSLLATWSKRQHSGGKIHDGARVEVERQIAHHFDRARDVMPCRDEDCAPASLIGRCNCGAKCVSSIG